MVYISLGKDHMDRATGRLPSLTWQQRSPYYERHGEYLVRNGSFVSGRPITTRIYLFLSRVLGYFGQENRVFPPLAPADSDYMCMMVAKLKDTFLKQYPSSRFIYYLHPFLSQPRELSECLTTKGVEWLEGRLPAIGPQWEIKFDGHPDAIANQAIAAEIAAYLKSPGQPISRGVILECCFLARN